MDTTSTTTTTTERAATRRKLAATIGGDPHALEGQALAGSVRFHVSEALGLRAWQAAHRRAPLTEHARPRASASEVDSLSQLVCERIIGAAKHRRPDGKCWRDGSPLPRPGDHGDARRRRALDVLAWIDRAERLPLTCARESAVALERSTGREHVAKIVGTLADSREWRDHAGDFRTRSERAALKRDRELAESTGRELAAAPMLRPLTPADENVPALGALAEAERRRTGREPLPTGTDAHALADALAEHYGRTPGEHQAVAAAILAGMPESTSGASVRTDVLAAELGISGAAMRKRVSRGGKLLRELEPSGLALIRTARKLAAELDLWRDSRAVRALTTGTPGPLTESAADAERAVLAVQAAAKLRARGAQHVGPWESTTVLALARNVRAGLARPERAPARRRIGLPVSVPERPAAPSAYRARTYADARRCLHPSTGRIDR